MTSRFKYIIACLMVIFTFSSCDYNDFDDPQPEQPVELTPNKTIRELINMYKKGGDLITEEIIIAGKVISSDRDGNIYKTLIIQDETGGIKIKSGLTGLYNFYQIGQTVYVKCKGLQLGAYGNSVEIGYQPSTDSSYETDYIPAGLFPSYVLAGKKGTPITPNVVDLNNIPSRTSADNTLIKLENVQFLESELNFTWSIDESSGVNRTLQDINGKTITVRTSGYSKFALNQLPEGSGSFTAILSYFNTTPQLTVISLNDVKLDNPRFTINN
mgnify:CR=1 FL=1